MGSAPDGGPRNDDTERKSSLWRPALALSAVGFALVASIGVGAILGFWLDNQFNTKPCLLISGALLGTSAGFVQLYRTTKRFLK